jgi:hypothetical protein
MPELSPEDQAKVDHMTTLLTETAAQRSTRLNPSSRDDSHTLDALRYAWAPRHSGKSTIFAEIARPGGPARGKNKDFGVICLDGLST